MAGPSTDLSTMTKQSVKLASFAGCMQHGHSSKYSYDSKKTGQPSTGYKFECRIVGKSGSEYVSAVFKGTEKEVNHAKARFTDGSMWVLSKIKLEDNTQAAYISSPIKISVDLKKTILTLLEDENLKQELGQMPVPPRTVAETKL